MRKARAPIVPVTLANRFQKPNAGSSRKRYNPASGSTDTTNVIRRKALQTRNKISAPSGKLRIKRIYESSDEADGTRVLVDRVWPRGMTKERAAVDLWLKEIAPSPALRKWFGHDPQRWPEFRTRYRAELDRNRAVVGQLLDLMVKGKVTLLYGAHDVSHNHAVVLIEYMEALSRR